MSLVTLNRTIKAVQPMLDGAGLAVRLIPNQARGVILGKPPPGRSIAEPELSEGGDEARF